MTYSFPATLTEHKSGVSVFLIWLVSVSGMIGISLGLGDWFLPKTPLNLLLGVVLLYWNFPPRRGALSILIWSLVFLIGMGVEMLGVNFGLLFGDYRYGENLGWKVLGVPLLIGINWVVLTFLTAFLSSKISRQRWVACVIGAFLMVMLDFFIEPIAPIFDFWHWDLGYAPLQNFVAWFGVALCLQFLVQQDIPAENHPLPYHHFASQFLFFTYFYVIYQF